MIKRLLIALLAQSLFIAAAAGHEVRPAYFEITHTDAQHYHVLWKQPVVGDIAVRLIPRLSNGWLQRAPARSEITGSFAVRSWIIAADGAAVLDGQTLAIEGLNHTITDVLVNIRLLDGRHLQTILKPQQPQLPLQFESAAAHSISAYFTLGLNHIISGIDHLLFVLALMLLAPRRWALLKTITAFTAAHSITLACSVLGIASLPTRSVDAVIALSILFLGLEAARGAPGTFGRHPALIAFGFGLLHGFAFADGLNALGLPREQVAPALLFFNLGVEAGQLLFVAAMLALAWLLRRLYAHWPRWTLQVPAYTVGALGAFWTLHYTALLLGWDVRLFG
jgi:hydrogenase/urease accessory protein HupE